MSPQVAAWVMTRRPSTPSETVGWEMGARTCLHVRPGRLTILECRFNKQRTTHNQALGEPDVLDDCLLASAFSVLATTYTEKEARERLSPTVVRGVEEALLKLFSTQSDAAAVHTSTTPSPTGWRPVVYGRRT